MTRKGSKQLTDEERASQVASPTIPPESEGEDNEGEDNGGRSPFFTSEVMRGVQESQKRRKTMTPEELAIEIDETRLSLGLIPMADLRQMKADHKRSEERDKQRGRCKWVSRKRPARN